MALDRDRARLLARSNALARIALGVVAMAAPALPLRPWVGDEEVTATSRLLARALGGRDLALGLGTLLALRHDGPVRGWVEAAGLADAGDVLITLLAFPRLPATGRFLVLGAAGGGVAAARLVAPGVDG